MVVLCSIILIWWIKKCYLLTTIMILTKRIAKFSTFNLYYRVTITTGRPMRVYPCFLSCGVNCNSTETISTGRWKQLETKTKVGKVWTSSEMHLKALTGRKRLRGCTSMKDVTSHSHLSCHTISEGKGRKCWKISNDSWAIRIAGKRMSTIII